MRQNWVKITSGIVGLGIVLVMLFANQLGLDNNPVWGVKRYILFFIGLLIFSVSLLHRENNFIGRIFNTHTGQLYLAIGILFALVIPIYIWFTSIGFWTTWRNETNYYDLLATAFSHGQVALEVQPDPAFLSLENLYEPENRKGIQVLWDATLYKGKYYIYWGPAPSLFLALIKPFYQKEVGDKILAFAFVTGTWVIMSLLILKLWKKYFFELPLWAVLLGIAFTGLVCPMPYVLVEGRIYEAAIASGQFFLIGGLFWLFKAFNRPSKVCLALAGLFFALAAGSRTTLIPSIAFLAFMVLVWAVNLQRTKAFAFIAAFALPLIVGALGHSWYNYVRFDSVTEFGLRYQLTSYNLYEDLDKTFSLAYIPPNLYKTLFNRLETRKSFPYLFPTRWLGPAWLAQDYPKFYLLLAEGITGIFISSPFMIFAFLAGLNKNKNLQWTILSIAGASFSAFITLQMFFFLAMRYLLDLIPALSLLAVVGFWQGLASLKHHTFARYSLSALGIILSAYSIAMSLLLSLSGNLELFKLFNPELLKKLTWTFNFIFHK